VLPKARIARQAECVSQRQAEPPTTRKPKSRLDLTFQWINDSAPKILLSRSSRLSRFRTAGRGLIASFPPSLRDLTGARMTALALKRQAILGLSLRDKSANLPGTIRPSAWTDRCRDHQRECGCAPVSGFGFPSAFGLRISDVLLAMPGFGFRFRSSDFLRLSPLGFRIWCQSLPLTP
jgi:hypothetical protein